MGDVWSVVSALSSALGTVVVIVAGFFGYSQIKEARHARHIHLLLSFQDKYHSPEARSFRHRLLAGEFGPPEQFDPAGLGADDFHSFWQLHDQLEVLGVLVERHLLEFDLVLACFHRSPPRVWEAIEPYIRKRRTEASPLEGQNFEKLVRRYRDSPALPDQYWERRSVL
ncbi:hypothetical protein [Streptomyces sp. UNOB3_S3]|uniref:DUF4760 domain-containing protein n=1 Tax=Streptomyces sp. UNOB3_S3 TaxID=2871682 RepID=UPI001E32B083|nr:hypothetical protein [Streptomyces sp. UNOB3_S3]MCC3773859.1 hypothetical protein [Streptomyces sp. UNOB3_S3]